MALPCKFSNRLERYCNQTNEHSCKSNMTTKMSASIIYRNKYMKSGNNSSLRNNFKGYYSTAIHAEMDVIRSFIGKKTMFNIRNIHSRERNKKIDLIIVRYNDDDKPVLSRPCNLCIDFMRNLNAIKVNKIYYFDSNGELVYEKLKNMIKTHISKGYRVLLKCNIKIKTLPSINR